MTQPAISPQLIQGSQALLYDALLAELGSSYLTTNLKLCLDAADAACLGTAGYWVDRSGVSSDNFHYGATTGADSSDPAWNPGGWFDFDGTQYFKYAGASRATDPTWFKRLHQRAYAMSVIALLDYPSGSPTLFSTGATNTNPGCILSMGPNITFEADDTDGVNHEITSNFNTSGGPSGQMNFYGVANDHAAGDTGTPSRINGTQFTSTGAAGSGTSGSWSFTGTTADHTYAMHIGARGDAAAIFPSGTRLAALAVFESQLSAANLTAIYNSMKGRLI